MEKYTDGNFSYEIRENHAIVTEMNTDNEIVEIPAQIKGVPVTELGDYLFSGKSCQCIRGEKNWQIWIL